MSRNHIIELNGKQYDAITGALLGESDVKAAPAPRVAPPQHQGRVIDGFVRSSQAATVTAKPVTAVIAKAKAQTPSVTPNTGKRMDIQRVPKTVKTVKPHQPQRAQTLMRHVVSKPKIEKKPAIRVAAPSEVMAKPASTLAKPLEKKLSVTNVDPIRLARSRQVARSHHIRRYSQPRQQHTSAIVASRPVQRTHTQAQQVTRPTPPALLSTPHSPNDHHTAKQQKVTDIFEAALAHANSHQEPLHPKQGNQARRRRRFVNFAAGLGAFLVIGGFIAYLNMPAIELRVASVKVGFSAEMPSYRPTGFALEGGVKTDDGRIKMTFRSGTSSYTITQEESDWNSATLLDQSTEQHGAPGKTIQSQGRIIYIYDDSSATWVNGGVHYEISASGALSSDELVSLATSM